jgi:2-polyprenyl-3-methyl-5-hydroxy-6-metoxy-1,4-benzoquinol methylase
MWRKKLANPEWIARDGHGLMVYACELLKQMPGIDTLRILDVGCGRGTLGVMLNKAEGVFGLDISEPAVQEAARTYEDARAVNLDEDEIPFPEASYDVAVMLAVIEHVRDPRLAVSKVYRALKPGGTLLLSTPNILWWWRLGQIVLKRRFPRTGSDEYVYDGGHLHSFTFLDIRDLLVKAGFSTVQPAGSRKRIVLADFRGGEIFVKATKDKDTNQ